LAFGGDSSLADALPAFVTKGLALGFATTSGDDIFNFRSCFSYSSRDLSHLGLNSRILLLEDGFHLHFVLVDYARVIVGYFAA
jgi:hypothetical protein